MLSGLERLRLFLRPPGKGIYTVSTGGGYAATLLKVLYGSSDPVNVQNHWEEALSKVRRAQFLLFGIPSDTGAGILRGSNFGPIGIREAYLHKYGLYPKTVVDLGDVVVVPQLLHDAMLNEAQIDAVRAELYPGVTTALPVSALSITEAVVEVLTELNPTARILVLGGDHSVSGPVLNALKKKHGKDLGILHFDAHTDLMPTRIGVKYSFATWAYHAHLGLKPQALVQVGIRTSARTKEQWMRELAVTQVWANEVEGRESEVTQSVLKHFEKIGIKQLYISNDIDGTDMSYAPATGTPEAGGLKPLFVNALMDAVLKKFNIVGADIVEVAPPLSGAREFSEDKTAVIAAGYLKTLLG